MDKTVFLLYTVGKASIPKFYKKTTGITFADERGYHMKYAFVIDQRKCIGCHACTVACKAEHDVPIGVYRTWVKYVERGKFPYSRRYFLVNRCNHCDDAPCVTICPTRALYKREDGIVDFDISNANPVWIHPVDARRIGIETGDLVRVTTEIGHYVNRAWVTEGIRPGIVACSHHFGRPMLSKSIVKERIPWKIPNS